MSINFLPSEYTKATRIVIVVPVTDVPDLRGPDRLTVIPERVEMTVTTVELASGERRFAHVDVIGPRRLKSGAAGQPIHSIGWEHTQNGGRFGYVARPDWLTQILAAHLPEWWTPSLINPTGGA